MTREYQVQVVIQTWRAVLLGRCWFAALLIATGHTEDAEFELIAVAEHLPLNHILPC
jgi:hypothetical protein